MVAKHGRILKGKGEIVMAIICCDLTNCVYNEDGYCEEDMIDIENGECVTYINKGGEQDETDN